MTRTPKADTSLDQQPPLYPTLDSWVTGYFTPMFLHRVGDGTRQRWCTEWWIHPEAIGRLTLLWTTWETARCDPSLKAAWWNDLDHHLPLLLAPDGAFRACRPQTTEQAGIHAPAELPLAEPAPLGYQET
ncbi:DUF4913 domain-containing protein [Cryptosporangium sp. NPDC051539]|uniref:DUF4913 domain-containing protein n=1 Tax=Cryptosporangium sp. NPDC051539 TaxID=3363962 RepID=UPI0037B2F25E